MPQNQRAPTTFTYKEIKNGILSVGNKEDRFLLSIAYGNGCRVGEITNITRGDVDWNDEFVYVTTPVLKKRYYVTPSRAPPISRKGEPWLADLIIGYVEGRHGRLISYGKRTAQRRFNQYFDCTSHSFRHSRATHCILNLNMSMRLIAEYFKLSPKGLSDWIMRYGHLDREDQEDHLRKRFKEE